MNHVPVAHRHPVRIPVLDQERERQVLQNKGELAGEELRPAAVTLFQTIMALSRRQQRDMMGQGADNPGVGRSRWRPSSARRCRPPFWPTRRCPPGGPASRPGGRLNREVLTVFAVHGLNMVKLESRPLPGQSWQYMFFLELVSPTI